MIRLLAILILIIPVESIDCTEPVVVNHTFNILAKNFAACASINWQPDENASTTRLFTDVPVIGSYWRDDIQVQLEFCSHNETTQRAIELTTKMIQEHRSFLYMRIFDWILLRSCESANNNFNVFLFRDGCEIEDLNRCWNDTEHLVMNLTVDRIRGGDTDGEKVLRPLFLGKSFKSRRNESRSGSGTIRIDKESILLVIMVVCSSIKYKFLNL